MDKAHRALRARARMWWIKTAGSRDPCHDAALLRAFALVKNQEAEVRRRVQLLVGLCIKLFPRLK
jgi:hypothetical protein